MQVIIAIGYDGSPVPREFYNQVRDAIARRGTVVSTITGDSWSDEWGAERASWFAAEFDTFEDYVAARADILTIGGQHNQDAVAFTYGNTDVAECHKPKSREYRDFL